MQLEAQPLSLPVYNYDFVFNEKSFKRHSNLFGGTCKRALIVGSSGCGKTNTLLTLLLHPNGLRFKNIYICCRSLHQPKYEDLKHVMESIPEISNFEYMDANDMATPDQTPYIRTPFSWGQKKLCIYVNGLFCRFCCNFV